MDVASEKEKILIRVSERFLRQDVIHDICAIRWKRLYELKQKCPCSAAEVPKSPNPPYCGGLQTLVTKLQKEKAFREYKKQLGEMYRRFRNERKST